MSQPYQSCLFNPGRNVRYYAVSPLDQVGFGYVRSDVAADGLQVAIKLTKPTSQFARDFRSWFAEQSVCLKCLRYPHIVTTYDQFCSDDGRLVIVMEKAGGSLASLVDSGQRRE